MLEYATLEKRFWQKVDIDGPVPKCCPELGPCWLWTACCNAMKYGVIMARPRGVPSRTKLAHILSYEINIGTIPPDREIDHLCRNPTCVNPKHLEVVTHVENMRRGVSYWGTKTHCPQGHPYEGGNLYIPPSGKFNRQCRICHRETARRWAAKQRAA